MSKYEYLFALGTLTLALILSYIDNLMMPLVNIFYEIFQMFTHGTGFSVFPFTIMTSFLTFLVALKISRSLLYALTLPFAFLGLFEEFWHFIPGSSPMPLIGSAVVLAWGSVGFTSARKWKFNTPALALILADLLAFAIWYYVGFSETTLASIALNIITKQLLAAIFIQLFYEGNHTVSKPLPM
ncbi:MAG: hypothetical protein ACREBQ_06575, partial [Nitrososphaerales archaeon]